MRLQIKTLAGPLVSIEVTDRDTVNDLKRRIHDAVPEAASKKIRLMKPQKGGKFSELVKSEKLLSSIGVKDGTELSLVFDECQELTQIQSDEMFILYLKAYETSAAPGPGSRFFLDAIHERSGLLDLSSLLPSGSYEFSEVATSFICAFTMALEFSHNSISSIDVSGNAFCGTYFSRFSNILASNTSITDLNLSHAFLNFPDAKSIASMMKTNTAIRVLDISRNHFTHSGIAAIAQAIAHNSALTELRICDHIADSDDFISTKASNALALMVKLNSSIRILQLVCIGMNPECLEMLADSFQSNHTITDLDISRNKVPPSGLAAIANLILSKSAISKLCMCEMYGKLRVASPAEVELSNALKCNTTLSELVTDFMSVFTIKGFKAFANMLIFNSTISTLYLLSTVCDRQKSILLVDALARNRSLTSVCFSIFPDEHRSNRGIFDMLQWNSTITNLDMRNSDLSQDSSVSSLASALIQNSTIQALCLGKCSIQTAGAMALAKMIRSNSTIVKLDLDSVDSESVGFVAIAEALRCNTTVQELALTLEWDSMYFGDHSSTAHAFATFIAQNSTITRLKVAGFGNVFPEGSATEMIKAMHFNSSITDLCMDFCFESADASLVADMITTNPRIKSLSVANNEFGDEGMLKIALALRSNTSITEFIGYGNCIGDISALGFCDTVKCSNRLKLISFLEVGERPSLKASTKRLLNKVMVQHPQVIDWHEAGSDYY